MPTPEEVLAELGLELPAPFPPAADYVACRQHGDVLYVSGHGPMRDGQAVYTGKVGSGPDDVDIEAGRLAAELTMLNCLASMRAELGELSRVAGFLKLSVFVNATPDFDRHFLVADGASQLLTKLFGPSASHARYAVGMTSLPMNITTEVEAIALVSI